jgi:hypothetical protein
MSCASCLLGFLTCAEEIETVITFHEENYLRAMSDRKFGFIQTMPKYSHVEINIGNYIRIIIFVVLCECHT